MAVSASPRTAPPQPPTISPAWIVGFVGHRTGIDEARLGPIIEAELGRLRTEITAAAGTLHFYSSVADGADLLALDVAQRLGLPLHIVLPLPEENFFQPFPSAASRQRAQARLAAIRAEPARHTWRVAPTSMELPAAYFETDIRIVEACDVLLVVWDGEPEKGLGGTAQIVSLARARQSPIVWIHKITHEVIREHFAASWPKSDEKLRWLARHRVVQLSAAGNAATAAETAAHLKQNLSDLANMDASWFRGAIAWVSGLSAGAALCGIAGGLLPHDTDPQKYAGIAVGLLEFAFLAAVLTFKIRNRRKQVREEWIEARFGADLYRGLNASQPLLDPLHPAIAFLRPTWRRFALTVGLLLHSSKAPGFRLADFRTEYDTKRLINQRDYFKKEGSPALRRARFGSLLSDICFWATPVFLTLAVINRFGERQWTDTLWGLVAVGLLPALLPLVGSLVSSLTQLLDYDRRAARYPALEQRLIALRREVPHQHTVGSLTQLVTTTEALLLDELMEWHSVTSRADAG